MGAGKRTKMPAIPKSLQKVLNPLQLMALWNVENFGWELRFVRRCGLEIPIPVVCGADGETIAVLDEEGNVDLKPKIVIRNNADDTKPVAS